MNKTIALTGLCAVSCITAPAFAQDTHVSLTKESVTRMQEITAALDTVTDKPQALKAVEAIKTIRGKLLDLGKRQLELPGATPREQAQMAGALVNMQRASDNLLKALVRLRTEGLFTPELQAVMKDLQTIQVELAQAAQDKASHAEPFPKDAEGNTHETLMLQTIEEVKKLDDSLASVKDTATSNAALAQIRQYRTALLSIAKKQASLPPLTKNQQAKMTAMQKQLVDMMQPIVKHVTAIMVSADISQNLKDALNSLSQLPSEIQKIREEVAK